MDCVFGLVGKDFALVVAGAASVVDGILDVNSNENKVMTLDSHKLMGASGDFGYMHEIMKSVKNKSSLYRFHYGIPMTTAATANFIRGKIATALHERPSYMVNTVLAGYDKETGPSLYSIDFIGTLHKVDKAAFGNGAFSSPFIMDCHYRSDMSVEEAVDLVDKGILKMNSILAVVPPNFVIKIVDKDGARTHGWHKTVKVTCVQPNPCILPEPTPEPSTTTTATTIINIPRTSASELIPLPPISGKRRHRRCVDDESGASTGRSIIQYMTDTFVMQAVDRTVAFARAHPEQFNLAPEQVNVLAQSVAEGVCELPEDHPLTMTTMRELVQAMVSVLGDVYEEQLQQG